jgi:5'-phosphate synthase pdxT subunit
VESFTADLPLPFLQQGDGIEPDKPFRCVFIRAPVVEKILPHAEGIQVEEAAKDGTIVAPSKAPADEVAKEAVKSNVEVMGTVSANSQPLKDNGKHSHPGTEDIVAVRQGNVFGTSFHPELTDDPRIHVWWLQDILNSIDRRRPLA